MNTSKFNQWCCLKHTIGGHTKSSISQSIKVAHYQKQILAGFNGQKTRTRYIHSSAVIKALERNIKKFYNHDQFYFSIKLLGINKSIFLFTFMAAPTAVSSCITLTPWCTPSRDFGFTMTSMSSVLSSTCCFTDSRFTLKISQIKLFIYLSKRFVFSC